MPKLKGYLLNLFFLLGERLAFLLLLVVASIVFLIETPHPVFSESRHGKPVLNNSVSPGPTFTFSPSPTATLTPSPTLTPTALPTNTPTPSPSPTIIPPSPTPTGIPTPVIDPNSDEIWEKIAECESHKNWSIDTGNGYFGGLQFSQSAWESVEGTGNPAHASREEQIAKGKLLQSRRGWGVWGACAKKLGLL